MNNICRTFALDVLIKYTEDNFKKLVTWYVDNFFNSKMSFKTY